MLLSGLHYARKDYIVTDYYEDFFFKALILFSILFAGFRYQIGNDYDSYVSMYKEIAKEPLSTYVEPGFAYVCYFLSVIGIKVQGVFLLFSTLTLLLIAATLKKHSINPVFSFLLFLLIPIYYFGVMDSIRQHFALSMVFYSVRFIIDKKFIKFLLLVLLAALFHKTALIILPVYFLAHLNYNRLLLIAGLLIVVIYPITSYLEDNILLVDYAEYFNSKPSEIASGLSLIVRLALFFIVLFLKDKAEDIQDKVIINIYLLGVILYFATISTEALSRISFYLIIFEIIAIVNVFYKFVRSDKLQLSGLYLAYCSIMFFKFLAFYGAKYVPGTSMGNINYTMNFKFFE
jgi:hypothetical protein